jgi:hypothetical protein
MPTPVLTMSGFSKTSLSLFGNSRRQANQTRVRQTTGGCETLHSRDLKKIHCVQGGKLDERYTVLSPTPEVGRPFNVKPQRASLECGEGLLCLDSVSDIEKLGRGQVMFTGRWNRETCSRRRNSIRHGATKENEHYWRGLAQWIYHAACAASMYLFRWMQVAELVTDSRLQ